MLGDGKKQHPTTSARGLFTADAPDRFLVAGYRRVFAPGPRRILLGEFNPLQPKSPFQGRADIDKSYDIATADVVHDPGRAQQRIFPATFQGNEELKGMAKQQMAAAETQIILATGQTKNRALRAGEGARVFLKHGDRAQNCLVTTLSLHGLDATAGRAVNSFAGFMSLVWKGVNPFSDGKLNDISAAIAQTEMGAFLRDTASTVGSVAGAVSTVTSVFSPISAIIALPDLISKAADKLGPTAAAVTPVTDASTKFLASSQIDFGNTFIGVSQIDDARTASCCRLRSRYGRLPGARMWRWSSVRMARRRVAMIFGRMPLAGCACGFLGSRRTKAAIRWRSRHLTIHTQRLAAGERRLGRAGLWHAVPAAYRAGGAGRLCRWRPRASYHRRPAL